MSETMELRLSVHFEGDHVWAEVLDYPGCFASGRDIDELTEALEEAISMWLAPSESERKVVLLDLDKRKRAAKIPVRAQLIAA